MSDLGALLRKAREQRGYTLDDIQDHTKIRKRYLEAIESGDYKVLPGSFYVRAFVKTYAETVGLDAEEVLRLYHKELPKPPSTEAVMNAEPRIKTGRRSLQHNDRWGKVAVSLLMWAFPIMIAVVIYIYLMNNRDDEPKQLDQTSQITEETSLPSSSASPTPTPTPSVTPSETPSPSVPAVTVTFKETRQSINYYEVSPAAGHKLRLEVAGKSWIEVSKDKRNGEKLTYENVNEAQTLTYELTGPIYVNVGRADLVAVFIDDEPVEDKNGSGPFKFLFTPVD